MNKQSASLTIFEGVDGSGKTTLAKAFAEATGARYVHFGPLLNIKDLTRVYVEAMIPALLGYQSVVFDRSWYSEVPYGEVYRGKSRLAGYQLRMLERLAARCGAVTIMCDPGVDVCVENFLARQDDEYLDSSHSLTEVHARYLCGVGDMFARGVPMVQFDYTQQEDSCPYTADWLHSMSSALDAMRYRRHDLGIASAGYMDNGAITLVGTSFANHGTPDPLYQWPFGSDAGCSQWLNKQLEDAAIPESNLLWVNADQDLVSFFKHRPLYGTVIALGEAAHKAVCYAMNELHGKSSKEPRQHPHPQYWRRFHSTEEYPLIAELKQLTGAPE